MRTPILIGAALLCAAGLAASTAQVTLLPGYSVTQAWMAVDADPRGAALGGVSSVLAEGIESLRTSPAGLDWVVDPELSLDHNEWDTSLGLREEDLGYAHRFGDGALGGALRYFSYGAFEDRDASGNVIGNPNDNAYGASLGYAQTLWSEGLHLGATVNAGQEVLSGESANLATFSLGGIYEWNDGLKGSVVLQDQRLGGDGGDAPTQWRLGLGWATRARTVDLGAEWDHPQAGDGTMRLGAEWVLAGAYSLRVGWRAAQGEGSVQDSGFSAGAGLRLGDLRLDYAYVPNGDFGPAQRLGATLFMGEGLFGGKIVIETSGVSTAAQAEYKDGMAAVERKDWAAAKVALQDVLRLQPGFPKADEIQRTVAEMDRRIAVDKTAMAKGGSKEQNATLARKLQEAQALFAKQQLVQARKKLDELFEWNPTLKEALELRRRVDEGVRARVAQLDQQAVAALEDQDLAVAVDRLRDILVLDDGNQAARARLIKLHPRIEDEVKRLHREGIDAYVGNDMDRAIALWQKALALDPTDPRSIRRDLEKAQKLQQLRAGK